jgi:hypothetical protein
VSWYRERRDERVSDYRSKKRQKQLLTGAGILGLAGGLARAPWAAKHAVRAAGKASPRVARRVARVSGGTRTRLASIERQATAASTPLAITSGATGSVSSLNFAGRLKRETKKEGQKLGIEKSAVDPGVMRSLRAARSAPGPARRADIAHGVLVRQQRLADIARGPRRAAPTTAKQRPTAREQRLRDIAAWSARSPVTKRAKEPEVGPVARRRAQDTGDDAWRASVSQNALAAHDRALPPYKQRHERRAMAGAGTAVLGAGTAGLAGRRLKNLLGASRSSNKLAPVAAYSALTAGGLGAAGVGTSVAASGVKGARGISDKQRAIRARGHQRGLDAVR